ncbi:MAG: hypothetical protein AB7D57_02050 [Desulfovibrionaceae bacterium]
MSRAWIITKLPEFVRDMFRNFCQASQALGEEFDLFDRERRIRFERLHDLVGQDLSKGLLWRLKDTAHHVFRNDPESPLVGRYLDWGLGYIFHETLKLMEDSYQKLNYAPWLRELRDGSLVRAEQEIADQFTAIPLQTEESMRREIERIRAIMTTCRRLLPSYLARHRENVLLARYIFSQNHLVRLVFGEEYDAFLAGIYGEHPALMYVYAAQSLRHGGWVDQARSAVAEAYALSPENRLVLQEKKIIDNWAVTMQA